MTYAEVLGRIQTIEARIAQLTGPPPASTATSATSATSAAGFASALTGATAPTDTTAPSLAGVTGDDVVRAAMQYRGVPYVLGGESKSGIDCSGLVQAAFKDVGVDVPRLVHEQQTIGTKVDSLKDAKPGDLIVLNGGDHVAIYLGNDTVLHAPYPGRTVSVQKAWFGDADITAIRRVVPATSDVDGASAGTTAPVAASTSGSGLSAATSAQAAALLAMGGDGSDESSTGGSSVASMVASLGLGGSSSTSQQLLAARAALVGSGG